MGGRDIVCVGFAEWDTELWTNQHHLMSRLAASGSRVLFVESLGLRRPTLAGRDVRRLARRAVTGLRGPRERDGVHVLSPLVIPVHKARTARVVNAALLPALVMAAVRRLDLRRPILWGYVPQAEVLVEGLRPERIVYHCVDDIAAQDGVDEASFAAAERRFVGRADLVLASAPALAERLRALSPRVVHAPNVADSALFATALDEGPVDGPLAALPRPRLVFTGAVAAKKLDLELLGAVARARPEWTIALVGPVGLGDPGTDVSGLGAHPNVHLLGGRRYEALPAVLRAADVGLIPYRRSRLTDSVFPMKVHEYLAAGLPVVATPLPALAQEPAVELAGDPAAFVAACERALADPPEARRRRSARVAGRSWEARIDEIAHALG